MEIYSHSRIFLKNFVKVSLILQRWFHEIFLRSDLKENFSFFFHTPLYKCSFEKFRENNRFTNKVTLELISRKSRKLSMIEWVSRFFNTRELFRQIISLEFYFVNVLSRNFCQKQSCGNYENSFSYFFDKNIVKTTFLLSYIKSWFHEIFSVR